MLLVHGLVKVQHVQRFLEGQHDLLLLLLSLLYPVLSFRCAVVLISMLTKAYFPFPGHPRR